MSYAHTDTDYVVSPGDVLDEILEAREIAKQDFADRCGRSAKFVSEIISGKAVLTEETALQFERVLGVEALTWVNLESTYRLKLARQHEEETLAAAAGWLKKLPAKQMIKWGLIKEHKNTAEKVGAVLDFLGVASIGALDNIKKDRGTGLAFRRSKSFKGNPESLLAWLRWGETLAQSTEIVEYSSSKFQANLIAIRNLTLEGAEVIQDRCVKLCADAGVWLLFTPELQGTCVSGVTRWIGGNPCIQLSLRHKSDDHLWFTLFHEIGHVLLHGKKLIFIDEPGGEKDEKEIEADDFAADILIPAPAWKAFVGKGLYTVETTTELAHRVGIAPGIVVGRLQFEDRIPYKSTLNYLKQRFEWAEPN